MRLTVPDDLADLYLPYITGGRPPDSPSDPGARTLQPTLEAVLLRVLAVAVPLAEPGGLALSQKQAEGLAGAVKLPDAARDPDRIIEAARDLADLRIGRHKLHLPAPVLRGLKERADREGKPLEGYLQLIIDKVTEEVGLYA